MDAQEPLSPTPPPSLPETAPDIQPAQAKPSKPQRLSLLIALALVVGVGLSAFAYFQNSPEKVAAKMREAVSKITAGKYSANLELSFSPGQLIPALDNPRNGALPERIKINLQAQGVFEVFGNEIPKFTSRLTGKIEGASQEPLNLNLELVSLNEKFFFKLSELPKAEGLDLFPLADTWFFAKSALAEGAENTGPGKRADEGSQEASAVADLDSVKKFYTELGRLYSQSFKLTQEMPSEKIAGVAVRHFQAAIDAKTLTGKLDEYQKIAADPMQRTYIEIVRANLASLGSLAAELWVGKKDFLPYRLKFDFPLGVTGGDAALTLEFSDYNRPVEIVAPAEAQDFTEVLQQVFSYPVPL